MKTIIAFIILATTAFATISIQVSDRELAAKIDHVFVARVTGVEMLNAKGRKITDPEARTGPDSNRTINIIVAIERVHFTMAKTPPKTLRVPLDSMMHYELADIKAAHSGKQEPFLLLLAGPDFHPAFPGVFSRPVERAEYFASRAKGRARPSRK